MIDLELVYRLVGAMLAAVAWLSLRDRENPKRLGNATFWGAYAATLLFGSHLSDLANGCLVLVLVLVGGLGGLGRGEERTTTKEERVRGARAWRNLLFLPALLVPALTLAGSFGLRALRASGRPLAPAKDASVIALGLSAVVALVVAVLLLRQPRGSPVHESRRLMDMIGSAAILPQMLAALGAVFALAGVGERLADLLGRWVPLDSRFAVVSTYTCGMALFTVVMGNAFAAFPVMTAAVGLPLVVTRLGGDPAVMASIGMLSGYCGTLMTPMAANFNVVPAVLLELPDRNGVIRAQVPTALLLLAGNTLLMYFLAFHR